MYGTVAEFLRDKIEDGSSLSFVSAYFTINAFHQLKDKLTHIEGLRFLFGEPSFIQGMDPTKTESKVFRLTEEGLKLDNYLPQNAIARACAEWIEDKVEIKSVAKSNFLHGKMYYIEKDGGEDAIIGSSNFTVRGLGLNEKTSNIELNLEVDSKSDCADLKKWFDNLWESDQVQDVKEAVKRYLENIYTDKDPEFIYFKTLYHVFEDFLENATDADFAQENPKFQLSEIWKKLYEFQKHGVQACIQKLKAYNGCIIADSVGLGKTFEALAIIKYFEIRGANVLVLCPKKLEQNWTLYSLNYQRINNPFRKDNFRYTVRAHSDLTDRGSSDFDWENFDLVVIDESHNFRNRPTDKYEEGQLLRRSRYNKLLEEIIKNGCQTQVLMLSATPVNNKLTDLENQVRLITEDNDNAFQNTGINSVRETLRNAQNRFEKWTEQNGDLSNQAQRQDSLAENLNADFFNLLDRLTIARSREHILKFYQDTDDVKIKFPDRAKPIPVFPEIDTEGIFPSFQNISTQIDGYKLALFNPAFYIKPDCLHHYDDRVLQHRESNLIGMMKVNFLKRLESSVHSFDSTLKRTIEKINELAIDIQDFLQDDPDSDTNYTTLEEAEEEYGEDEDLLNGTQEAENETYQYEHLNLEAWLEDLQNDRKQLTGLQRAAANITPDRDAKLEQLKTLIEKKGQKPTENVEGKLNPKVLVFTAFADTANYLYENIYEWAKKTLQIECAVVTGSANKTTYGNTDFNEILTNFSPISKERTTDDSEEEETPEIDILIGTDCISEGQNLQDCDYIINYDIHWNPVRIIQRFGRIDRIGSKNKLISMVNFWPTPELDEYINLKVRVEARMALVNLTATGYDNPLTPENRDENLERVWSHRDEQLRRMQTDILDFDDLDEQLNINQFTLDDFRAQLLNYIRNREDELRQADLGLYAVTEPIDRDGKPVDIKPGVIFCLKQVFEEEDNEEGKKLNPLHPYYLVYVTDDEVVSIGFTNPKRILERFSALCIGKSEPDTNLCDRFNEDTNNGSDMTIYQILSDVALESIRAEYIRKVNDQLDSSPDALLPTADSQITEETEFELITWLVIGH